MNIDLSGKIILITGASRGIGYAASKYLMQAGATLALHYKNNREKALSLLEEPSYNSQIFQADLENPQHCMNLFTRVKEKYKGIDILINNAGVSIHSPLNTSSSRWIMDWEKTMAINLNSVALLTRMAICHFMEDQKEGKIINIASRAAFRGDTADYLAYAASKGGMVALTRSIARAFGKKNITAFTIAPGFVRTDMSREFFDAYGEDIAVGDIALPRLTEPGDIAPTVAFLCSGLADHATGCTIDINAGSYVH